MRFAAEHSAAVERLSHPVALEVARRINGERLVVLGWGRAILMQLAHPLIAAGVDDHSTFRAHPLAPFQRLHSTIRAMLSLTFGTPDEVARAVAGINGIHDRVHGTLPESAGPFRAGTPYSAHDPELLLWVQLTLVDTLPLAYETFVAPLSAAEKDEWCREARTNVDRLGVPVDRLPATYDELSREVQARLGSGELAVSAAARRLAHQILHPTLYWATWPWSRLNRLAIVGLLPSTLREAYGFGWTPADARALARWSRVIRTAAAHTPPALRRWRIARRVRYNIGRWSS
jgi:uncharacterized protein (DUF2236 family)